MAMMENIYYLAEEKPSYINFPEVRQQKAEIQAVIAYAQLAQLALADYNEGRFDRVDMNADEIQSNINRCRKLGEALGNAPKVCFDVLMDIREVQKSLQKLLYLKHKFGNAYIGQPTTDNKGGGI